MRVYVLSKTYGVCDEIECGGAGEQDVVSAHTTLAHAQAAAVVDNMIEPHVRDAQTGELIPGTLVWALVPEDIEDPDRPTWESVNRSPYSTGYEIREVHYYGQTADA